MTVLVTGVAGFIGYHLAERLLAEEIDVYGIDINSSVRFCLDNALMWCGESAVIARSRNYYLLDKEINDLG